ncbi:lytic polysaccharide monooxygenase, partial [Sphaerisporangium sp. NPDC049002]|uniref:lytic polysaccharide monooxygenase n=1 Tax=Sphaerisporangium sp. NPDC049002 TaxID=3155392 RepID=UPI003410AFDD
SDSGGPTNLHLSHSTAFSEALSLLTSRVRVHNKTGKYTPSQYYSVNLSTSGRSGRAVVYMIWQASHMDQTFFMCSDVNFVA